MTTMLDTTTAELDATVAGPVLEPGDPGYAEEVASFSLTFTAAPAVVVGATSAADVAAAVRYAPAPGVGWRSRAPATACRAISPAASSSPPTGCRTSASTPRVGSPASPGRREVASGHRRSGPLRARPLVGVAGRRGRLHARRRPRPDGRRHGFSADHVRRSRSSPGTARSAT